MSKLTDSSAWLRDMEQLRSKNRIAGYALGIIGILAIAAGLVCTLT